MIRFRFILRIHAVALLACLLLAAAPAAAQYPTKSPTMIVPFGAGGSSDAIARVVADGMARTLGQSIIIENDGGAGGTIATARAARATPDGYVIIMGNMGTHGAAPAQYRNLKYDPRKDFTPIGLSAGVPMVIVTRLQFPANTLKELVQHLKENPGRITEGHAGVGSQTHAVCTMLLATVGASAARVAYRSTGQVMNDMVGGQIDFGCAAISSSVSQIQARTIKALAVASPTRIAVIDQVPTSSEAGVPEFRVSAWNALLAPRGLADAVLSRLVAAHEATLEDPVARKRLTDIGAEIPDKPDRTPAALQRFIESEVLRWSAVLKSAS